MREISGAALETLKSQKMIGNNRFAYDLKFDGVDYYSPIDNSKMNMIKDDALAVDFIEYADGSGFLVAYRIGLEIFLSVVTVEMDFFTIPGVIPDGTLIHTLTESDATTSDGNISIFKMPDQSVLLFVSDPGYYVSDLDREQYRVLVYKSTTGLIADFAYFSTVWSGDRTAVMSGYTIHTVSKPAQLENGRLILVHKIIESAGGFDQSRHRVSISDDDGATWLARYTSSIGLTDAVSAMCTHNILVVENEYSNYICTTIDYPSGGAHQHLLYSEDGGETWTRDQTFLEAGNNCYYFDLFLAPDGFIYRSESLLTELQKFYRATSLQVINKAALENYSLWEQLDDYDVSGSYPGYANVARLTVTRGGSIHWVHTTGGGASRATSDFLMVREVYYSPVKAINISVTKGKGSASNMVIEADNKNGLMNPKNPASPLYNVLRTNHKLKLKQGYGVSMVETFTGLVDNYELVSLPRVLRISCRDNLKRALDQVISYPSGQHTFYYENWAIENIFKDMCFYAGLEWGQVDETGMSITVTFSWESYADVFQFISDLTSFEYGCDEYGKAYFVRDYQPEEWELAYTFEAGVDIENIGLKVSDEDLYSKVVVFGKQGENIISYEAAFIDADEYGVLPQKILKIDVSESSVEAELRQIAERALYLMKTRAIEVKFSAPAVPWLQVGDFIQVFEETTMSAGVYRIASMRLDMAPRSFWMQLTCFYYADSISPYDLPTENAVQTPSATTNLIPNMTSDTTPSGVCRSSSVYVAYE